MASKSTIESIDPIEIDGSMLEGGGQILRISTALSCLLNKPICVSKIRANRKDGGLKAQHLTGIQLLAQICHAKLEGDCINSKTIKFFPNEIKSGRYMADIKTAGSVCLLLQCCVPSAIFAAGKSIELDLKGGTNADHAPTIDTYEAVFCPIARKFGVELDIQLIRRGYYPKGGGELYVNVKSVKNLSPIELTDFGQLKRFYGRAYVAGVLPIKIAERMASTAEKLLKNSYLDVPINIDIVKEPDHIAVGSGCGIIIIAETTTGCLLGTSELGSKGLASEDVAKHAVHSLLEDLETESCVDKYIQDQIIVFMALAKGKSKVKCGPLTLHTETAIKVTEMLTGAKFIVSPVAENDKKSFFIECDGISFTNPNSS